jgi:hypothetical protein
MKTQGKIAGVIRWTARILSALVIVFVLFFLLADIFGPEGTWSGTLSSKDAIAFAFFPLGSIIGLALAWKWEGLGGLVAVLSIVALVIVRPGLLSNPLLIGIVVVPGLLFIVCWYLSVPLTEMPRLQNKIGTSNSPDFPIGPHRVPYCRQ